MGADSRLEVLRGGKCQASTIVEKTRDVVYFKQESDLHESYAKALKNNELGSTSSLLTSVIKWLNAAKTTHAETVAANADYEKLCANVFGKDEPVHNGADQSVSEMQRWMSWQTCMKSFKDVEETDKEWMSRSNEALNFYKQQQKTQFFKRHGELVSKVKDHVNAASPNPFLPPPPPVRVWPQTPLVGVNVNYINPALFVLRFMLAEGNDDWGYKETWADWGKKHLDQWVTVFHLAVTDYMGRGTTLEAILTIQHWKLY
eukprot:GHVS01030916.1.p1 GENE.GHVS01030916.1~~GHVS01030916.1.p1  ORF type:complete len:259 (-),score=25.45 GHVS01030916.1:92-868(-)